MKFLTGIAIGLIAHQADHLFRHLERNGTPPDWLLLARYGTGYSATVLTVAYLAEESNDRRDVALAVLRGLTRA